jgi:hypothetical protein
MADGLTSERVHWALAHPVYGPWLRALVYDISGFSATGADEYWWKPEDEPRIRKLVDEALGGAEQAPETKKPGRRKGSEVPISDDTVLEVLRLIVEENARPRAIADATDGAIELSFVNRIKAGAIVKWAEAHPVKARRAVDRQEIPADFPATDGGRLLPKP